MKISLCLIVWNELKGCQYDVPKIPVDAFNEIYAVDGGSTDGTVEYLESKGIRVYKQPKKGLNAAYIHANELSQCDAVVAFFPKATIDPGMLTNFRPLFEQNNELIIASRLIEGSVNEEDSHLLKPRKWGVAGLAYFVSIIWRKDGYLVKDVLHGVKGWARSAFDRMQILDYGLSVDLEMVVRAYKLKIKRIEFPVVEIERNYGATHFKILPTAKRLLAYMWFEFFRCEK